METKYEIGDKVYLIDDMKIYTTGQDFVEGKWVNLFDFQTPIPNFNCRPHNFMSRETRPKLTKQGKPYKNGEREVVSRKKVYFDWTYTVIEIAEHPDKKTPIYLIKPKENTEALFQVMKGAISFQTREENENRKRLEFENTHLGKWEPDTNTRKNFPEELKEKIYDKDQRVLFGSSWTKGIVYYVYAPGKYMKTGRDFILYSGIDYNGKGCDLTGKRSAYFHELAKLFPDNTFE
jgi:hypothetical protein